MGGGGRGGGTEHTGKRTHGHGQQWGDCWEEAGITGLNGSGKNTMKIKSKKQKMKRRKCEKWERKEKIECSFLT